MFRILTDIAGGQIDEVPMTDLRLDRAAFLHKAGMAGLTWLCNPNNPTGELLPIKFVAEVAQTTPGVLVVDEAYFEISGVTALPLIESMPNVVICRTLSKAFGLAGVRVGYALAGPAISDALRRVRPPGSISVVSEALGAKSMRDLDGMRQRVAVIKAERERLSAQLAELGLEVRDSAANFLLVHAGREAAPALLRSGLVVRTFGSSHPLADYIRVTVRRPEENARLVAALRRSRTPRS